MRDLGTVDVNHLIDRHLDRRQLDRYFELLMEQNRMVNLVSRETTRDDFDRLVGESVLPLDLIATPAANYLDIGAGGGIPAIPLLLSGAVTGESFLVERTLKKARALESIIRGLEIEAAVLPRNFEELQNLPPLHLVTLRLVKPGQPLLSRIYDMLAGGGVLVYYSRLNVPIERFAAQSFTFRTAQDSVAKSLTILHK